MVYQLKTKKYYGNAKKILEITPVTIDCSLLYYMGDCMVFNTRTDDFANGSLWMLNGDLMFTTCDNMSELVDHVKKHEILLVTSCGKF